MYPSDITDITRLSAELVLQNASLFDSAGADVVFLLARVLFGAVIAFTGLNHFLNAETMVGYAGAKGIPAPNLAVPFSGGLLLFGGLGIVLGVFPTLAAGAIAVFLLVATPTMHDFWAAPAEEQMTEMTQFLKNVALLGTALGFLVVSQTPWPLAVGVGL
ncbi:quinol oxidase [Salinigranum rubrum]|uniref:Quinol oxidase n=1 Tax=Salinigranum rubrum TaxID=755307 RepID=A0A2I8VKT3_9EURY|nr:DoxX family protein [Salinigranum rubrum]AUV81689.1 quinol oxidase [Salinigranum rubrum]